MNSGHLPALSARDNEILDALVHRVRVFSVPQVGRTWWAATSSPEANARKRLSELQRHGLVLTFPALIHPELPLEQPVACWGPGEPAPNFGEVSYRLQSRWTAAPGNTTCVIATKLAGEHFGGSGGRLPRESEQTHDVHLASVFLIFRNQFPPLVRNWLSEATILREREDQREKLPDAIIRTASTSKVIEFGGAYPKERVEAFHFYCEENAWAYELW